MTKIQVQNHIMPACKLKVAVSEQEAKAKRLSAETMARVISTPRKEAKALAEKTQDRPKVVEVEFL